MKRGRRGGGAARRRVVWRRDDEIEALKKTDKKAAAAMKKLRPTDVTPEMLTEELTRLRADLPGSGVTAISVVETPFEIVCEELCGLGHSKMRGEMIVVSNDEYMNYLNLSAPVGPTRPATQPVADAAQ